MNHATTASAWSVDGATFRFRGHLGAGLRLGGFVSLSMPDGDVLGQILSEEVVEDVGQRYVIGSGRLVSDGSAAAPFEDASVDPAPTARVRRLVAGTSSPLTMGRLRNADGVPAVLDARGFNRHTFLCGQSGSGKTYALGVLLEQLVLHTRLPLLVLDPNGDHVHLGRPREDVDAATAEAYSAAAEVVRVLQAAEDGRGEPLRIRFSELGVTGTAAILQLDPIADREEYNAVLHVLDADPHGTFRTVAEAFEAFGASGDRALEAVRQRGENLGVDRMSVWAGQAGRTVNEAWTEDRPRVVIADSSGFEERRERLALAVAVLQQLWARRKERRPLLLVVDEAHDVCPADPADALQRLTVDLFGRIAGEGRKYGIHLLLASQRPDKLPENVLSQCDNLLLMRVNSAADRATLAQQFGFAPPGLVELAGTFGLVELAGTFGLGEALAAGKVAPVSLLMTSATRLTPEGGADVSTAWATR